MVGNTYTSQLSKITKIGFYILVSLLFLTFIWPWLGIMEGYFMPVTTVVTILDKQMNKQGLTIYVEFEKLRPCEFIGLAWYKKNRLLALEFTADANHTKSKSRSVGNQLTGPWVLSIDDLAGTRAVVRHQCNPFWITHTEFYP